MTRPRTYEIAERQREIVAALREADDGHIADRLLRCTEIRLSRRRIDGWPEVCGSAGCRWCGPTLARRWWRGVERWAALDGFQASLVVLSLDRQPGGLRAYTARLRRALRDARDRAARRDRRWRGVALAGMATGNRDLLVLVRHAGIPRAEVADVIRRRWPGVVIGDVGSVSPSWMFTIEDAAEVARTRRGVEPLRVVVLAQRASDVSAPQQTVGQEVQMPVEPMPIVF